MSLCWHTLNKQPSDCQRLTKSRECENRTDPTLGIAEKMTRFNSHPGRLPICTKKLRVRSAGSCPSSQLHFDAKSLKVASSRKIQIPWRFPRIPPRLDSPTAGDTPFPNSLPRPQLRRSFRRAIEYRGHHFPSLPIQQTAGPVGSTE